MNPSNGESMFNFCNYFNTIQLDKEMADDCKTMAAAVAFGAAKTTKMPDDGTLNALLSSVDPLSRTKDLKSLFGGDDRCNNDMESICPSDKSLNSFGSESNDSSGDPSSSSSSETLLLNLTNGFINCSPATGNEQPLSQHMRHLNDSTFFPFSSPSNSSSPPLSAQATGTSGSSTASSLSEVVNANVAFNSYNNNKQLAGAKNGSNMSTSLAGLSNFNTSGNAFNTLGQSIKPIQQPASFGHPTAATANAESIFLLNNTSLDNALNSLLSSTNKNDNDSNNLSSLLTSFEQRPPQQPRSQMALFAQQDSLPQINNSLASITADAASDPFGLSSNCQRKASFMNSNLATANLKTNSSNPVLSNSSLLGSSLFNDQTLDVQQRTPANNIFSPLTLGGNTNNQQLQARFDGQIRAIANEINSAVQLHLNNIQMRKEQLMKQLDHVRNAYTLLLSQNANNKNANKPMMQLPKIAFTRPDQNLVTSVGFINTPAFAPCCLVAGEGLNIAIEGEPTGFSVSTRNCFNEEILTGGDIIDIEVRANEAAAQSHNSFIPGPLHIQKNILDNNNGKYNVTYTIPRGSGLRSVKIFISINGTLTNNSPYTTTVKTERLRENWKLISLYGEEGTEPGKFCRPWGIAITRLPLQKDPGHKPVGDNSTATIPINSKSFYNWTCSAFKKDYLLAVADRSNNRIQLLKLSVPENATNNATPTAPGQFLMNPVNKVEISVLHVFGSGPGTRPGNFDRPAGIAINSNLGQLVVADKDNHRIQVFDLSGTFLFKFGEKGSRPGHFCYPWDVAVCPQTSMILVSDTRNRRIQLFTHFGQHLWYCGQPLDSPRGVAFITPERYVVSDFNKHRLLIIDKNDINSHTTLGHRDDLLTSKYIGFGEGSGWGEFLRPQGLVAVVKKNNGSAKYVQIFCADSRNNRIAIHNSLNQSFDYINEDTSKVETLASVNTTFDRPSGLAIADNILAVIDFGNNRLQIFQKSLG